MILSGVWKDVQDSVRHSTLEALAAAKYPVSATGGHPTFVLGVNASGWIHECRVYQPAITHAALAPELETLFTRLARLLHAPVVPLFVFDGPSVPKERRAKITTRFTGPLERGLRQLIVAFGFPWYMAPGDADAELARLNVDGAVDAVASHDGHAVLFGAQCVVCSPSLGQSSGTEIVVYDVPRMSQGGQLSLSQGGLLLQSLLREAHLCYRGMRKVPDSLASTLARSGLGDALLDAVRGAGGDVSRRQPRSLAAWRNALRHVLCSNSQGFLDRPHRALAESIPDTFPDPSALELYARPLTSWSNGGTAPDSDMVSLRRPDLQMLTLRCEQLFGWETAEDMCHHFRPFVWPGMFLRELQIHDHSQSGAAAPAAAVQIFACWSGGGGDKLRVLYDPSRYLDISAAVLRHLWPRTSRPVSSGRDTQAASETAGLPAVEGVKGIWVAAALLERSCPALVDAFKA